MTTEISVKDEAIPDKITEADQKQQVQNESKIDRVPDTQSRDATSNEIHSGHDEEVSQEEKAFTTEDTNQSDYQEQEEKEGPLEISDYSMQGGGAKSEHEDKKQDALDTVSFTSRQMDGKSDEESDADEENTEFQFMDGGRESLFTQAGSYKSTSSSSLLTEDETLPKNFQEYIKKYPGLFSQISGREEKPCDKEAGKTFLKIDLNDIVSGYRIEDKMCQDVKTTLRGMTRVRPDLICIENEPIVLRKDYKEYKGVRTLSGGHMGYEPLYIDYVGKGMLTGVVVGTISDPPSVASITKAIRELATGSPGLLIIIQNNVEYRLIFGLAMERVRMEGFINIDMITVGDDCFERCKSPVGRRGLSGIVLLYKLVGSMADSNKGLREIYIAARSASKSIVTISCMTKPFKAIGTGLDKNSKDGIHFNGDTCQMVKRMIDYCLHPTKYFSMRLDPNDNVIVFINSYRTTSPEFYIVVDYIMQELEKRKIHVERVYADNFVTGFWAGFSITLLLDYDNYRATYIDDPCSSSLWPRTPSNGTKNSVELENQIRINFTEMGPMLRKTESRQVKVAVIAACKAIMLCENVLNSMHFFGNYGTKLRLGVEAILKASRQSELTFSRPFNLLIKISEILIEQLPGVMGAMYGCLFEGAARSFVRSPLTTVTAENWSEAMDEALKTLRAYTNAKGGIVSLALSLIPVVSAIHGPYISLPRKATKNPVLCALDSLRFEIEERTKQSSEERESILKNQLDVESYALIIWLHAIYSSVYWKVPSDISLASTKSNSTSEKTDSRRSNSDRKSSLSVKGINKSLEFISTNNNEPGQKSISSIKQSKQGSESPRPSKEGKIFT